MSPLGSLRITFRTLVRRPTFTAVAVATIALGVGATTAVFSVASAVLVRPLPFAEPDRLVNVEGMVAAVGGRASAATMLDWAPSFRTFEGVAAHAVTAGANLTGAGEPARVEVAEVSADFFRVLGIEGVRGRALLPDDAAPGRTAVAVLSDALWRDRFASDPAAIGGTVEVDGRTVTVVGVAPSGMEYPGRTELWLPAGFDEDRVVGGSRVFQIVARLAPGATLEAARAEMDAFVRRELQGTWLANRPPVLRPLHDSLVGRVRPALLILLGAVGFVTLIACANLANLFLARTEERSRELALCAALGAARARLAGQVLLESAVVAAMGGALGILLGIWGLDLIVALAPASVPRLHEVRLDGLVFLVAIAVTAASAVLFGSLPALRAARMDAYGRLREGGHGIGPGRRARSTSRGLVVVEVALTIVLLVGSSLLIRSVQRLHAIDPGFDPNGVLTASVALPAASYPDDVARTVFFDRALKRVRALPGVVAAGAVNYLPLGTELGFAVPIEIEGRAEQPGLAGAPTRVLAGPGYLEALGIPVVAGRSFADGDGANAPPVAIISRSVAEAHWPDGNALGARIRLGGDEEWREVIGIAGDVRTWTLQGEPSPQLYIPYAQTQGGASRIVIRSAAGQPGAVAPALRAIVRELDPALPVYDVRPMSGWVAEHLAPARFNALLLSAFAGIALVLALVGIYGVVAGQVIGRTHEIGVRMALGAQRSRVLRQVIGEGLRLALGGALLGIAGGWALARFVAALLYGVTASDPVSFIVAASLVLVTAAGASFVPARRASRMDPTVALRDS